MPAETASKIIPAEWLVLRAPDAWLLLNGRLTMKRNLTTLCCIGLMAAAQAAAQGQAKFDRPSGRDQGPQEAQSHEAAASRLRQELSALVGLKRLPQPFDVRREAYREVDDLLVRDAERRWPDLGRRRVSPDRRAAEAFTTERILFAGVTGEPDIVGVLRTPKKKRTPPVAVLCLHGHARGLVLGKEITECYAVPLAENGFTTFAPDALAFGERRRRQYDQAELTSGGQSLFLGERVLVMNSLLRGETLFGKQLAEFVRCVDFLEQMPGKDRIAVMGHSMGGIYAFWLGALDERVDVTVCLAGLLSYRAMVEQEVSRYHGIYSVIPGMLKSCDTSDVVALIAPRRFYGVHAEMDAGFPIAEIRRITSKAKDAFRLSGSPDNLVSEVIGGDHGDVLTPALLRRLADHEFFR